MFGYNTRLRGLEKEVVRLQGVIARTFDMECIPALTPWGEAFIDREYTLKTECLPADFNLKVAALDLEIEITKTPSNKETN